MVEVLNVGSSVGFGIIGGTYGGPAAVGLALFFGVATGGTGLILIGIFGGVAGGVAGGLLGSYLGTKVGKEITEVYD
ncbi:hypothetical protein EC844_12934 [Acinetobacter calcoaceticus]|uniref:Uncharacterized protein n=1 Tax=Acinetobacter calcoaceticus TaxID=471 RepID=A0A4R1XEE5_ACICA|nr:hypothetical protein EC844_12934 [Acinetobacter calcoaceticus]